MQRTVLRVAKKDESNAGDLWDRNALLQSKYPEGTYNTQAKHCLISPSNALV